MSTHVETFHHSEECHYLGQELVAQQIENGRLRCVLEKLSEPIPEPPFKWKPAQAAYWRREAMKRWVAAAETLTQDAHS